MEQRIISQDETKIICYIKENTYAYYLIISSSKKVNLVLNIIKNITEETVKQINSFPNKAIIIPKIDQNILSEVSQNQAESFQKLDSILSEIINSAYQLLTYNHLEIENTILLNRVGDYKTFYNWFSKKYQSRVLLTELDLIKKEPPKEDPIKIENSAPPIEEELPVSKLTEEKSLGFISYVLLGVVVAIASLIFLYLLI